MENEKKMGFIIIIIIIFFLGGGGVGGFGTVSCVLVNVFFCY
jgi:hypothetical protein